MFDVWGGPDSMDHLARRFFDFGDASWPAVAASEVSAGFLVNVRMIGPGEGWGDRQDFDHRGASPAGRA
ncbi:hypothetical protein D3877_12850 [Azospirillum cavernae]|uniref:Uncharacterized protein n=1 Tax=Azospirillum cavernae TaxID=2320860 RepID=A0A418VVD0_9PROT|nr:hypothetical protein D3877_12850 [Azospirillum cavernae]